MRRKELALRKEQEEHPRPREAQTQSPEVQRVT